MDYQQALEEFEEFLHNSAPTITSFHPHFETACWEMLKSGGKRFRPSLLLAIVHGAHPLLIPNAFMPALALECIHTYSLIHDDLPCMDNASLRRGQPTLHHRYDEATATLVGDGLNTYAFFLISNARLAPSVRIALIQELALASGIEGMVLGQALDCYFEHHTLPLEQLYTIHTLKTAKLIAASLVMGAIIASMPESFINEVREIGMRLGVFFQIRDDLIDALQDEKQAGKPTHSDGIKNSYVNLLGLHEAKTLANTESKAIKQAFMRLPPPIASNLNTLLRPYITITQ